MSEHNEQAALFQWAETLQGQIPQLKMLYAIPNGGHRHKAVAAKLKTEGVKAGVLDVNLDVPKTPFHGLRIEMKFGKNKLSDNQIVWVDRYIENGYSVIVCYSWQDAAKGILTYLGEPQEGRLL